MPSIQSLIVDEVIPFDKKIKSKLKGVTPFDSHIIVTPSGTILLQLLKKRQKFPSISSLSLAAKLSLSLSLSLPLHSTLFDNPIFLFFSFYFNCSILHLNDSLSTLSWICHRERAQTSKQTSGTRRKSSGGLWESHIYMHTWCLSLSHQLKADLNYHRYQFELTARDEIFKKKKISWKEKKERRGRGGKTNLRYFKAFEA